MCKPAEAPPMRYYGLWRGGLVGLWSQRHAFHFANSTAKLRSSSIATLSFCCQSTIRVYAVWNGLDRRSLCMLKGDNPKDGLKRSSSGSLDSSDGNQCALLMWSRCIFFWKDLAERVNLNAFKDTMYGVWVFFRQRFSLC